METLLKPLACAAMVAVALPAAGPAAADGSAFVGGLVGGMLGSAIGNAATQQRTVVRQAPARTVVRQAPAVDPYTRQQNREVQTALNYFGFPAGAPDGVLGRNSRAAIAQYQGFMGYPATGYLTEYERTFLTAAYSRALIGGPQAQSQMAAYGQGPRGLLLAYRAEQQGIPAPGQTVAPPPSMEASTQPPDNAARPQPSAAPGADVVAVEAPAPAAPAATPAAPGLPSFVVAAPDASMASACNRVSLVTSTNGGFVTLATLGDPAFALDEQFCLARSYAIEDGEALAAQVEGVSAAEIRAQCEAFAPAMLPYVSMLGAEPPETVDEAVRGFIVKSGAAPAQVTGNARICLGVGYRTDDAELALGSALLLEAAGEAAYGEHVGHHLLQGFGAPRRPDRAAQWLDRSIDAMQAGASPVVSPGTPERIALLRAALDRSTGAPPAAEAELRDASAPALPNFAVTAKPSN